jgi:poly(3-hydroxybutyrate) depolymerase
MTTAQTKPAEMTTGSVVSKDGTRIGYLRVGRGPAVVLLHGSNESARSHTQLALALAETLSVYLPGSAVRRHTGVVAGMMPQVSGVGMAGPSSAVSEV